MKTGAISFASTLLGGGAPPGWGGQRECRPGLLRGRPGADRSGHHIAPAASPSTWARSAGDSVEQAASASVR